jgi:hypothetical protein
MNRWINQEIDNAKCEDEAWRFGQGRGVSVGVIARGCDNRDHVGAIICDPGDSEGPALREMPHDSADAE